MDSIRNRVLEEEQKDYWYVTNTIYSELIPYIGEFKLNTIDFKRHFMLCMNSNDFYYFIFELDYTILNNILEVIKNLYYNIIFNRINSQLKLIICE